MLVRASLEQVMYVTATLLGPSKRAGTGESGQLDGNSWGKTSSLQRWKHIGRALLLVYSLAGESGVDIGQHW